MNNKMKTATVCGESGFIRHLLVRNFKKRGYRIRAVDLNKPEYSDMESEEFFKKDSRDALSAKKAVFDVEEVYQLTADTGGIGYIWGTHDADIMQNSIPINLNVLEACQK